MPSRLLNFSNASLERVLKIAHTISNFSFLPKTDRDTLLNVLAHSPDGASPELKLKVYEALLRLRRRRRNPFGMLVVLGWKQEWDERYASLPDTTQNIFEGDRLDIAFTSIDRVLERFAETADFDGAILINARGEAVASGMYLENMRPKRVAKLMRRPRAQDLSSGFGFAKKVHTRHLAGIAASYWLKDTTVFVISEEDGSLRVCEEGRIIWSTIKREMEQKNHV